MSVMSKEEERAVIELFARLGFTDPEAELAHAKAEISAARAAGKLPMKINEQGKLTVDAAVAMKLWPRAAREPT